MRFYVVIPAHNEADCIQKTLQSLIEQTHPPEKIMVVDDCSTDDTAAKIQAFAEQFPVVKLHQKQSNPDHLPGSKVVEAFLSGLAQLDNDYDVLCKFDADLIFPSDYLATLSAAFQQNPQLGMAGGFCYIYENHAWKLENLTDKEHLRGALKAYRKACYEAIGGLKTSMGWDTVDELLTRYHGWELQTFTQLHVKHLRPTGFTYHQKSKYKQGEAFYKLGYGFWISLLASLKLALRKKSFRLLLDYLTGYMNAKKANLPHLVSEEEAKWIRAYRWKKINEKLLKRFK